MKHWKLFLLLGLGAFALWCVWQIVELKRANRWTWTAATQEVLTELPPVKAVTRLLRRR
jgi:hypothetical protein